MNNWPQVKLGQLLKHRKAFILIDDLTEYKRCRVQLHAQGVVLRDSVVGAELKTKKQQVCKGGDFLVAEIDAKVGGYGIIPPDLDGAVVSSHYFLFDIDESKLERGFLDYFCRTPGFHDQVAAQGSTNYAAIRPSHVLDYQIPLPPVPYQRRIVAKIEELATKINEARKLRQQSMEEAEALILSVRRRLFGDTPHPDWVPLSRFVDQIENGRSPQCDSRPATPEEWGVLKVGAVSFGVFNDGENKALPVGVRFDPRYEVCSGDFLMSRANTTELVGACAIVGQTRPRLLLSDKTFRFHVRRGAEISLQWLDEAMKSPALRNQIERGASGTSPTMKNISKEKVMLLLLPPHSAGEQHRALTHLSSLKLRVDSLKKLQAGTTVALHALLPSILDKAFNGKL